MWGSMSSLKEITAAIAEDLHKRLPEQRATQRRKLSELVAGILVCQTPNLMELSNVLDRPTQSAEARYNYVERFLKNPCSLIKARFRSGMITHVGILHEKGHPEPWYIAMDSPPSEYKTRDYGLRWGIENMFSDFKSRGFSLMQTHIRIAERLQRLVLVLSIALHWAVSTGLTDEKQHPDHAEKRGAKNPPDPVSRFLNAAYGLSEDASSILKSHILYGFIQTDGW